MSVWPRRADDAKATLTLNVHTDISSQKTQTQANELAISACNQFIANGDEAITLATRILGVEISR